MKIYIIIIFTLLVSCSQQKLTKNEETEKTAFTPPDSLYILDSVLSSVDSIYIYYDSARKFLDNKDTVGANIYFDNAFTIINKFDENTKSLFTLTDFILVFFRNPCPGPK